MRATTTLWIAWMLFASVALSDEPRSYEYVGETRQAIGPSVKLDFPQGWYLRRSEVTGSTSDSGKVERDYVYTGISAPEPDDDNIRQGVRLATKPFGSEESLIAAERVFVGELLELGCRKGAVPVRDGHIDCYLLPDEDQSIYACPMKNGAGSVLVTVVIPEANAGFPMTAVRLLERIEIDPQPQVP